MTVPALSCRCCGMGCAQFGGFDLISLQQIRPDAQCRAFLDQLAVRWQARCGSGTVKSDACASTIAGRTARLSSGR